MKGGKSVGIVLTSFPSLQNTTVYELISYGRIPYQDLIATLSATDREAIDTAIETVGIGDFKSRMVHELSDGEKQKVMIARALAQGTDVLLLDEPSAFLDYPSKMALMQLLSDLAHRQGKAILLSTHDVELAMRFADVISHINGSRLSVSDPSKFSIDRL